jgi:hypothetical protein
MALTQDGLRERAVALDLSIRTTNHEAFSHRLIGVHTPWDLGGREDDENLCWSSSITNFYNEAPYSCQSLTGDTHACLPISETTSSSLSTSRIFYAHLLCDTNSVDL